MIVRQHMFQIQQIDTSDNGHNIRLINTVKRKVLFHFFPFLYFSHFTNIVCHIQFLDTMTHSFACSQIQCWSEKCIDHSITENAQKLTKLQPSDRSSSNEKMTQRSELVREQQKHWMLAPFVSDNGSLNCCKLAEIEATKQCQCTSLFNVEIGFISPKVRNWELIRIKSTKIIIIIYRYCTVAINIRNVRIKKKSEEKKQIKLMGIINTHHINTCGEMKTTNNHLNNTL